MKNNPFLSVLLFLSAISSSCTHYVQLYETKTTSPMQVDKSGYTFENDTVKVVYSFWANHGTLSYTVFNKLNVPIYIDWKKSSYIKNSDKLDYWIDGSFTRSVTKNYSTIKYRDVYGQSYNQSTTVKPEQIVFIAPQSTILKDQFILFPFAKMELLSDAQLVEEKLKGNPLKISRVKFVEFSSSNSPLIFRNFLTISTSDKFDKETYIDNGFYLYKVSEMNQD